MAKRCCGEDFAINRNIMTDQLQYHGLRVIGTGNSNEAIVVVKQTTLDLILMDIPPITNYF